MGEEAGGHLGAAGVVDADEQHGGRRRGGHGGGCPSVARCPQWDGPVVAAYVPAQIAGAIAGAILADAMFGEQLVNWSTHDRSAGHLLLGEVVATAGLVLLIFGLARTEHLRFAPVAVASYIGAAYWFTSSTSFANPAVTVGRAFTDTFAGIAPSSVPGFIGMQLIGGAVGLALAALIFTHRRTSGSK
ncbi:hypothetical protein ACIRS1_18895 [Kitasatospora sp. NPDC101176]|uniref:hypothetical protein n=1 Tax=Kitasatospora sp. NPDC101176 TaxID=3364099 RepID=UPI0037F4CFCE